MTLVVPRSARAKDFITGGQDSVAIRVPSHLDARAVLLELREITKDPAVGVAAPSANRFGRVSPTTAAHVVDEIGGLLQGDDVVLDGGDCAVGVESTIIDCTGPNPKMLRPGAITTQDVEAATGLKVTHDSTVRAPGTLNSHYSPNATVQLIAEANIAFEVGGRPRCHRTPCPCRYRNPHRGRAAGGATKCRGVRAGALRRPAGSRCPAA